MSSLGHNELTLRDVGHQFQTTAKQQSQNCVYISWNIIYSEPAYNMVYCTIIAHITQQQDMQDID